MHVVILPSWYKDPERTGSGIFFKQQADALALAGCKVSVVYAETRSLRVFSLKKFFRENHFQIVENLSDKVLEFCLKSWSTMPQTKIGMKLWVWLTLLCFARYIKKHGKPDIIHAHSAVWAGYSAYLIWEKYKIPYIITEHITAFNLNEIHEWWNPFINSAYSFSFKNFAVSPILASNINKIFDNQKIEVLPNFVDTEFFRNSDEVHKSENDQFIFFSLGNLVHVKGFDILIEAFAKAYNLNNAIKLYIGGVGPLEQDLKTKVNNLGLSDKIIFVGNLNRKEVRDYFQKCNAFVLASRVETFGVVFIEALASGKPVIATECGGPEDFVNAKCGYVVKPGDPDSLSKVLIEMVKDYINFDKIYLRKYVGDNYDSKVLAEKLIEVYKETL